MNTKRLKWVLAAVCISLFVMSTSVYASNIDIYVSNERLLLSDSVGSPFMDTQNRTMVPLKVISEHLGHTVEWIPESRKVVIDDGVEVTLGNRAVLSNGKIIYMDTEAKSIHGRTYVPLKFVAEALGHKVGYEAPSVVNNKKHIVKLNSDIEIVYETVQEVKNNHSYTGEKAKLYEILEENLHNYSNKFSFDTSFKQLGIKDFNQLAELIATMSDEVCMEHGYLKLERSKWQINGSMRGDAVSVTIEMDYRVDKDQHDAVKLEAQRIISQITNNSMSDSEKIKAINKYVIKNMSYDYGLNNYDSHNAMFNGLGTCFGFTLKTHSLLEAAGIESHIISGSNYNPNALGGGGLHAWNLVKFEDGWYHMDTTFNSGYQKADPEKFLKMCEDTAVKQGYSWEAGNYPSAKR